MRPDVNDVAFRMKKILEAVFPWYFPESIYGINWQDPKLVRRCLDHANKRALASLLTPPEQ
jgi:hypothetical protein